MTTLRILESPLFQAIFKLYNIKRLPWGSLGFWTRAGQKWYRPCHTHSTWNPRQHYLSIVDRTGTRTLKLSRWSAQMWKWFEWTSMNKRLPTNRKTLSLNLATFKLSNLSSVKKPWVCIFLTDFPLHIEDSHFTSTPPQLDDGFMKLKPMWTKHFKGQYWHRVIKLSHEQVISAHRNGDQN